MGASPRGNTPSIHVAFAALEDRLAQMEQAFNTNTQVFSDGIQMLEAQNAVLRRVANDLYLERVRTDGASIDFNGYLREYVKELAEAEAAPAPEVSAVVHPDSDSPIIFGGDT